MYKRLIARSLYYPTLGFNMLMGRFLKVRNWWDRVNEYCVLGAVPLSGDPARLRDLGITGVINMCEEYAGPVAEYERLGIEQLWLPTTDFQHPTRDMIERGAEFLQRHRHQGGQVYVHCKAGRARSATVVLWWLVRYCGLSREQAQQHLLKVRPHVHSTVYRRPAIEELVRDLERDETKR
jgi:atypical dual specificity phosphatase